MKKMMLVFVLVMGVLIAGCAAKQRRAGGYEGSSGHQGGCH